MQPHVPAESQMQGLLLKRRIYPGEPGRMPGEKQLESTGTEEKGVWSPALVDVSLFHGEDPAGSFSGPRPLE